MDRRTKILAIGFGAIIAYVVIAQVVYPSWIRPLMTIDERIAERRAELEKLEKIQTAVDDARIEYRDYVARVGSFDPGHVETAIRDRLNAFIEKHKLENASTAPSRPVEDRKTGLTTSLITVSAVGSLESAVKFLKDVSEIPELVRVGNPALYPAGSGRKGEEQDLVNVRLPIEVLVLPKNQVVGPLDPANLPRSEAFVRHDTSRDYSEIWNRKPFTPYVELPPLRVDTQKVVNVEVGQQGILQATPSGGDGNYTVAWTPTDGVTEPNQARTPIDTSVPRVQTYTVTVSDTVKDRVPVTATVAVNVREKPKQLDPTPTQHTPQPIPQVVEKRDPDHQTKQVVMTLLRNAGTSRTNELMVFNSKNKETTYHKVTEDFDGGKLVFVHQTGGIVHRKGQYLVYPLGTGFDEHMDYKVAENYPELKAAAERAVALETAQAEAKRQAAPLAEPTGALPAEAQPTLDSRGGGDAGPTPVNDPAAEAASGAGPIFPVPGAESEDSAVMGPPDQTAPAPTIQNPPAQPGAKTPDPNKAPRSGNTRQRPSNRGKVPGRV